MFNICFESFLTKTCLAFNFLSHGMNLFFFIKLDQTFSSQSTYTISINIWSAEKDAYNFCIKLGMNSV